MLRGSILALVVCAPAVARADEWSLHLLGAGMMGWTDNVFSAPDEPVATPGGETVGVESALYYQITTGALFSYERPRMVHEVSYELDANFYPGHGGATALSHRAGWRGHFLTGPRSDLGATALYSMGQTSAVVSREAMPNTGARQSGSSDFVQGDLTETFNYSISRPLRLTQGALARRYENKDDYNTTSTGMELGGSLGIDRAWRYNAVGLLANVRYVDLATRTEPENMPAVITGSDSMNVQGVLSWRRDLGRHWSSLLDGGATVLVPINEGDRTVAQPTFGGQLTYFPDWGQAYVQVRRSMAPNLYIAQNMITDSAVLSVGMPLPWLTDDPAQPRLTIQGTGGVTRTQVVDLSNADTDAGFDVIVADLAVAYTPRNAVAMALRAQHLRQDATGDNALVGFDYDRTTVMFTIYARWPDRLAGEVPANESLRVQGEAAAESATTDDAADSGGGSRTR